MKIRSRLTLFLLLTAAALPLYAADFAEPILLTSCGQSADVLMVKSLLTRDSLQFSYAAEAGGGDVSGKGSVILVLGGSSKGLGAAKISADQEMARVQGIIDAAAQAGVPVLAIHVGGLNRRGALSDPFNAQGAGAASRILVVKGGNDDGYFTKIAAEKQIPLDTAASAFELGSTLKTLYGK